ncbi:hypothetical protein ACGFZR_24660 [Streptomyces sp. NPDC048241]|uniref:hypothetical protein n=1 Tax=Streptomyces sp. NPDC048241 TaxID=3365521 RepID=UPI00371D045E
MPETPEPTLRDRIAEALNNARHTHPCPVTSSTYWTGCYHPDGTSIACHTSRRTDAVLAVLPAPVDRAAVLREAANALALVGPPTLASGPQAWTEAIETLRRMADEASR